MSLDRRGTGRKSTGMLRMDENPSNTEGNCHLSPR